jgi:recombination DNA repair RAD52 pathway protein
MKKHIEDQVKKRVKGEARKKIQADKAKILKDGSEECDPQPIFEDIGFTAEKSMEDKIREITLQVQADTAAKLAAQNLSDEELKAVLDEENDFEIPDDFTSTVTQYEAAGLVAELEEDIILTAEPVKNQADGSDDTVPTPSPAEQSSEAATGDAA